jgi:hypothetical protein
VYTLTASSRVVHNLCSAGSRWRPTPVPFVCECLTSISDNLAGIHFFQSCIRIGQERARVLPQLLPFSQIRWFDPHLPRVYTWPRLEGFRNSSNIATRVASLATCLRERLPFVRSSSNIPVSGVRLSPDCAGHPRPQQNPTFETPNRSSRSGYHRSPS